MHGQNATYPTILYNSGGSCHLHVPYRTFLDHPTQSCGGFCFKTIKPHGQFLVVPNEMHPPTQTQFGGSCYRHMENLGWSAEFPFLSSSWSASTSPVTAAWINGSLLYA